MAKAKRKKRKSTKSLTRRINSMSKPRRKRRRSTGRRALSAPRKATPKRRRRRGLSDSHSGIMAAAKKNGAAGLGGLLVLGTRLVAMPTWARAAVGFGGSVIVSSMLNFPAIGAGMAGAATYQLGEQLFGSMLHDDMSDLEDVSWVDPNTLSDSGMEDENGNAILCDGDGIMYQLQDNGDLVAIGDMEDLEDGMNDSIPSVSMLPLQDYSLSSPYAHPVGY